MKNILDNRSFQGIKDLYGSQALINFNKSTVTVIGIGGVGSWIVEALARSGIGHIIMIDMDSVCISNINRQICALHSTLGEEKIEVMQQRVLDINPECKVSLIDTFVLTDNISEIFSQHPTDFIVDAIDNASVKASLINYARQNKIKIISLGASGGKTDPTCIKIDDIKNTIQDPLLRSTRNQLNQKHGYKERYKNKKYNVPVVYSTQAMTLSDTVDKCSKLGCTNGYGSITHITASFAFFATHYVLMKLAK